MFDGITEIRKSFDNKVIMTEYGDGKLLKLKGSSPRFRTLPTSLSMEKVICHLAHCGMQDLVI